MSLLYPLKYVGHSSTHSFCLKKCVLAMNEPSWECDMFCSQMLAMVGVSGNWLDRFRNFAEMHRAAGDTSIDGHLNFVNTPCSLPINLYFF